MKIIAYILLLLFNLFSVIYSQDIQYLGGNNDGYSNAYRSDVSELILSKPNGGEQLYGSTNYLIVWTAFWDLDSIRIEYSIDNGINWNFITNVPASFTTYLWQVPNIETTQGLIRISNAKEGYEDISDATFSIKEISLAKFLGGNGDGCSMKYGSDVTEIVLISPIGGEQLYGATNYLITWAAPGSVETIKLEYSLNDGTDWEVIDNVKNEMTQYLWQVPNLSTTVGLIRISDVSSGMFGLNNNFSIKAISLAKFFGGNNDGFTSADGSSHFSIINKDISIIQPNFHLNFPLENNNTKQPEKYSPNKVVVKLKDNVKVFQGKNTTSSESVNSINDKYHIEEISYIFKNNSMVVNFKDNVDIELLVKEYEANPDVEYAHPDYLVYLDGEIYFDTIPFRQSAPNDSLFKYQWYLENTGQFGGQYDIDVDMLWGWNIENKGDTVAVLDTRVARDHKNLPASRLLTEIDCVQDELVGESYHGLAVSLIIAGEQDNGTGISGIAPKTVILPVRVLNEYGVGTHSILARGIYEAVDAGVKIINMSVGSYAYSKTLQDAVEYAYSKGAIIICAAGNDNNNNKNKFHFPSDFKECISVGAMDNRGNRWQSSNYGGIDFLAPGVDIVFDGKEGDLLSITGTSAAAPIVTGIVSLIKSKNPNLTNDEIRAILQVSSIDIGKKGYDDITGYGRVNSFHALLSAQIGEPGQSFIIYNETDKQLEIEEFRVSDKKFLIEPQSTNFIINPGDIYPVTVFTNDYNLQGILTFTTNEKLLKNYLQNSKILNRLG